MRHTLRLNSVTSHSYQGMGPERYSQASQAPSRLDPEYQDKDSAAQAWLIQLGTLFPELDQAGTRRLHSPRHRPSRGRSCPGSSQRNSSARQITWALGGQPGSGQHKGPCLSSPRQQAGFHPCLFSCLGLLSSWDYSGQDPEFLLRAAPEDRAQRGAGDPAAAVGHDPAPVDREAWPPPLCGAIPASGDYVARPGDKVAAQ
ncbi:uncharacterized protein LOC103796600 [Callithrix jacchus]